MDLRTKFTVYFGLFGGFAGVIYAFHNGFGVGVAGFCVWLLLFFTILAAIRMFDESLRPRLIAHLEAPDYRTIYRAIMTPVARWPRDWRLYDWALRLAVFYPFGLAVLGWGLTGRASAIGGVVLLPTESHLAPRLATIGALCIALLEPTLERAASTGPKPAVRFVSGCLPPLTIAVAVSIAGVITGGIPLVFMIAVAVIYASMIFDGFKTISSTGRGFESAVALGVAVGFAVGVGNGTVIAVTVASGMALLVAAFVDLEVRHGHGGIGYLGYTLFVFVALFAVALFAPWKIIDPNSRSIFLILGILPTLNAVFDYASYAVTLTLIRWGLRLNWGAALLGLLDLALAALLYTAAGATMIRMPAPRAVCRDLVF